MDEIFAGTKGKGAVAAAYGTAIIMEYCKLHDKHYTGASADIYKCFDQIVRELIKEVLTVAGMPAGVLKVVMKLNRRFVKFACILLSRAYVL